MAVVDLGDRDYSVKAEPINIVLAEYTDYNAFVGTGIDTTTPSSGSYELLIHGFRAVGFITFEPIATQVNDPRFTATIRAYADTTETSLASVYSQTDSILTMFDKVVTSSVKKYVDVFIPCTIRTNTNINVRVKGDAFFTSDIQTPVINLRFYAVGTIIKP